MVFSVWLHQRRRRIRRRQQIDGTSSISDRTSSYGHDLMHLRRRVRQVPGSSELDPAPAYTARVHCVEELLPSYEQFVASLKEHE